MQRLKPYLGTRAFYKGALGVMIPVMVQQLVNNLFNMIDNVMVGSLAAQGLAMSAVNVANKPFLIFSGLLFGLMGAGGLLISQFFGAKDRGTCQGLFWLQMGAALLDALVFFALLYFAPEWLMRLFVTDERTVALGVSYLRIVCFSYFPAAVSSVFLFSLRSIGQNRTSMLISLASMGVNALCNYALIFGAFGFPRLGVAGAAWGTLIARLAEMGLYLLLMARGRMYFGFAPGAAVSLAGKTRRAFAVKAAPLITNELLWTVGQSLFFWSYARLDEPALPALTIAELCFQIAAVIAMGNSSAVAVLIGTELGAGRLDRAKENCKKLALLTLMISAVSVVLCCGLAQALPYAYSVSGELRALATRLATLMAVFAPVQFTYGFCFFCLRAGGDTRSALLLDSVYMWLVPVPLAVAVGLWLPGKIGLTLAVTLVQLAMYSKVFLALRALRKGRWIRNITAP